MTTITSPHEQNAVQNHRKGLVSSSIAVVLLLLFILLPLLSRLNPPPGQEGILISFGSEDVGEGDEQPFAEEDNLQHEEQTAETPQQPQPEPEPTPEPVKPTTPDRVVTDPNSDVAIKKETPKTPPAEKPVTKPTTPEPAKPQTKPEPPKPVAGSTFGKKDKTGQGDTGKPGDQGIKTGDPNGGAVTGDKSTGTGTTGVGMGDIGIGGSLQGRGVKIPKIENPYNSYGTVVVSVCVDADGKVTEARTTKGTTATDANLKSLAVKRAQAFKFDTHEDFEQCGTITINFKAQ